MVHEKSVQTDADGLKVFQDPCTGVLIDQPGVGPQTKEVYFCEDCSITCDS